MRSTHQRRGKSDCRKHDERVSEANWKRNMRNRRKTQRRARDDRYGARGVVSGHAYCTVFFSFFCQTQLATLSIKS